MINFKNLKLPNGFSKSLFLIIISVQCFSLNHLSAEGSLKWDISTIKTWWLKHESISGFEKSIDELNDQVNDLISNSNYSKLGGSKNFVSLVSNLYWAKSFCLPFLNELETKKEEAFKEIQLMSSADVAQYLTKYSHFKDNRSRVTEILLDLRKHDPSLFKEYIKLAVAISLVWDTEFPENWPHHNVNKSDLPIDDSSYLGIYKFFINSQVGGKLFYDPRRMTVRELCFVVDSPLAQNELQYAQQIKIKKIRDLANLYKIIPYDQNRINGSVYVWPYGQYNLIKIGTKNGGICMDQSFFVSQTAKAMGIPSILFTGQGRTGAHAWLGTFDLSSGWNFEVGKWENENYPIGYALDPQTWNQTTNSELGFYLKSSGDSPSSLRGKAFLALALLNENTSKFSELVRHSASIIPRSMEPWEIEYKKLNDSRADLKSFGRFWSRWINNFKEERGLKAKGQISLLRIFNQLGMTSKAESLSKQIINENKSKRFDLGISIAHEEIEALHNQLKWDQAQQKFILALNNFGKDKTGGHLFYNLIQPYVQRCFQFKKFDEIDVAKELSEKYIERVSGTILDNDFKLLFDQIR